MSYLYSRRNMSYGLNNPLQALSPQTIVAKRTPTTLDVAELGTIWVNKTLSQAFICNSVAGKLATWSSLSLNSGQTIAAGNLVVAAGNITASGTINANGGLRALTGGLIVTAGDAVITLGNLVVATGTFTVSGDITVGAGNIAVSGAIGCTGLMLAGTAVGAAGDTAPAAGVTAFTNVVETGLAAGEMTINTTTANPGSNTGFIKFYVGATPVWVPYFADIAP